MLDVRAGYRMRHIHGAPQFPLDDLLISIIVYPRCPIGGCSDVET